MDTAAVISRSSRSRASAMAATVSGILSPEPVMPHTTFSVIVITSSGYRTSDQSGDLDQAVDHTVDRADALIVGLDAGGALVV